MSRDGKIELVSRAIILTQTAITFDDGVLTNTQSLPIANTEVKTLVEGLVNTSGCSLDKRFVYNLPRFDRHLHCAVHLLLHITAGLPRYPAGAG